MEYDKTVADKQYTRETEDNHASVSDNPVSTGPNNSDTGDKKYDSNMKEGYTLADGDRPVRVNMDQRATEDTSPCHDMSLDNSKEDSDFSDYSEDNNRSQLANQALRAKLLNGVLNPITSSDSKLRVSVFDHRIIPKKLIIARKNDNTTGVDTRDNLNENKLKSQRGANVNEQDNTNKRKGHNLSYTVLKASRKSSTDNPFDDKGENSKMESDNEVRTRFDILLRNLIGDVSEMQVEPSPMTVSSGYESDYIQTREADIDKMFNKNSVSDNKENIPQTQNLPETSNGHSPVAGTVADFPMSCPLVDNHQFTSLPSIPTQQTEKPKVRSYEETETPKHGDKNETDSNKFNYAQRHNYKLTKVTRSMYEIIHDLQNGEKPPGPDGRKRSRKAGRKSSQDLLPGSDGSNVGRENRPSLTSLRIPSESEKSNINRNNDVNGSSVSGSVVRCVRRPFANDPSFRPAQRKPSQSDNSRLGSSSSNNDCDKVQNDLRNLLCDTSDVKLTSADNNERAGDFNTLSSGWSQHDLRNRVINGQRDAVFNQPDISITPTSEGDRRPTLTQQFMNRPKPEDHVYETIPGDEKLYEEWKKMRENPKIPKIRRYTTVPDLPGTFIPKEPPALPARRYLNNNNPNSAQHQNKDHDDYIFMGDINSNFPSKDPSGRLIESGNAPNSTKRREGSSARPEVLLEPHLFQCYPYTLHDENVFNQPSRGDETSDGYCSIDNLSLCRESLLESPPELSARDWRPTAVNSLPRAPLKRSDFFLHPHDAKRNGFNLSNSHLFADRPPVTERRVGRGSESEAALRPPSFERDSGKPVFQATYV